MKSITIPERFGYPTLEITINGKEQTFNSGVEIEVEDSVAEAIENAIALEPKQGMYKSKLAQFADGNISDITAIDLNGAETIAYYAFGHSYLLTSVEIPNTVRSIGDSAFAGCNSLTIIKFEDNSKLKSIGSGAFEWCGKLERIYLPETPPTLANSNVFASIKSNCTFYCKSQESLNAYKAATNWSTLTGTYTFKVEE